MRRGYLVCYDIRDAKRLRRVHKAIKGFGRSWQYSVFFCHLTPAARVRLESKLLSEINQEEDHILILDLGDNVERIDDRLTNLGQTVGLPKSGSVVV